MRLVISTLASAAIIWVGLTLGSAAGAIELSVVGPNSVTVLPGEQVTLNLNLTNLTGEAAQGLGASVHGYDESVADFNSGQGVSSYLNSVCLPGVGCFGGFGNLAGGTLVESAIGANGPRVQIALSASLVPVSNTGAFDQGLDGVEGSPQFSLIFDAIAPGITTLFIDTMYTGDAIVLPGGTLAQAVGSTFTINVVPEPGTALLMSLGLIGLAFLRKSDR